ADYRSGRLARSQDRGPDEPGQENDGYAARSGLRSAAAAAGQVLSGALQSVDDGEFGVDRRRAFAERGFGRISRVDLRWPDRGEFAAASEWDGLAGLAIVDHQGSGAADACSAAECATPEFVVPPIAQRRAGRPGV